MIQENEIIVLFLALGVLIFILGSRQKFQRIPVSKIFVAGFYVLLAGWILTVLEGLFWQELLNILEHICYAASSVLMAVWCWKVFGSGKDAE